MAFFRHPTAFHRSDQPPSLLVGSNERSGYHSYFVDNDRALGIAGAPHSSHPSLPHLTLLVFEAVLEVVCVSLPGYLAARQGFFNSEMQKFTANLNVALFTPCLIFVKLASKLTADKLVDLAIIPAIFTVQTLVSWSCALIISKAFRLKKRPRNFVVAMGVFGNSNSLPISLVISLSQTISGLHWDKLPGDNDGEVQARGILYLLIFQQLGQLVRWSWGYNVLLAPPDRVDGTASNENSRMENGIAGAVEENARLIDISADSDSDDEPSNVRTSQSKSPNPASASARDRPVLNSGDQTPVTYQQYTSPSSSTRSYPSSDTNTPVGVPSSDATSDNTIGPKSRKVQKGSGTSEAFEARATHCKSYFGMYIVQVKTSISKGTSALRNGLGTLFLKIFGCLPSRLQKVLRSIGRSVSAAGHVIWAFMNPPLWAMLAAIVVASIPDLQRLFFTDGTFIKNSVTSAIDQNAGVAVPLILVVLGGNLARSTIPYEKVEDDEDPDDQGMKLLLAALISRMLLPFLIMAPILALTAKYVPVSILDDPIFVIVCFLITGAPSALQLAQICQINNVYMKTMSRLLFQSYVVWILPSTLILVMCALEVVEWAKGT